MRREIIPYKPLLKELARKLRQNMTFSEVKLWNELKNGKMMGYDFDRQKPIGNYIVDFYCKDLKLALEVDGITHQDENMILKDEVRQHELEMLGVSFLRFDALLVVNKVGSVLKEIEVWIDEYESKNGVVEFVKRKRNPPLPLPGGDASTPGVETTLPVEQSKARWGIERGIHPLLWRGEMDKVTSETTGVGMLNSNRTHKSAIPIDRDKLQPTINRITEAGSIKTKMMIE